MKVYINRYYFDESEKSELIQEVKEVLGRDFDSVELFGHFGSSYESIEKINNLDRCFEIVDYGSRETLAERNDSDEWIKC